MPHFENLDKYEGRKSPSGRKRIIPIAPHSLQAADYRPKKTDRSKPVLDQAPQFEEVEFEPISVRQMEKEFRQAAKDSRLPRHRKKKLSLKKRISRFFSGLLALFRKDGKKAKKHPSRRHNSNRGKNQNEKSQKGYSTSQRNKRRRRKRPEGHAPEQRNKSQKSQKKRRPDQAKGENKGEGPAKNRPRKRNRPRRNRSPQNKGQQGSPKSNPGRDK